VVVVVAVAVVVVDLGGVAVVVELGVTIDSFFVTLKPVGSIPLPDWLSTVTNLDPTAAPLAMTIFAMIWVCGINIKPRMQLFVEDVPIVQDWSNPREKSVVWKELNSSVIVLEYLF